jgi:hypothetical protein
VTDPNKKKEKEKNDETDNRKNIWKKSINTPVGTFEAKFDITSMTMARIAIPLT